jgi:hypothetical protein
MFADPTFLAALAETALTSDRPAREIIELILRVAIPATYALYSARLKLSEQPGVRPRFVSLIRELGIGALPMIRAGLARLESKRDVPVAAALAADLFEASPRTRDDEAGELASRYVHGSPRGLAHVAVEALVAFWGPRATPLLLGLLHSNDSAVAVAAMRGLHENDAIDEYAVAKIAMAARDAKQPDVLDVARAVLADTTGDARQAAQRALSHLVSDRPPAAGVRR